MHLLLTDRLVCPRCGPGFGLILLAERMLERRVHDGTLGCPNCRDAFTVRDGFADLRAPPRGELPAGRAGDAPADEAETVAADRLVALLGIHRGPGTVALVGEPARFAPLVAQAIDDVQVVAVDADSHVWPDRPSVSRVAASPGLPFHSGMLRGAVVDASLGRALVFEGARVIAPKCRVVLTEASDEAHEVLEEAGLEILASEAGTVVATRG